MNGLLKEKNGQWKITEWLMQGSVVLVILSFPFTLSYRIIPLALLFGCTTVEFIIKERWKALVWNKYTAYFLVMLFFFALAFIYYPFEHPYPDFQLLLEHRLSLLGFGLIGVTGVFHRINLKLVYYSIIVSGLLVVGVIGCIQLGSLALHGQSASLVDVRQAYVNYHMGFNFSLNMGLIASGVGLIKYFKQHSTRKNVFLALSFALLLFVLLHSEGRSGFVASILITGGLGLAFLHRYYRKWFWAVCVLLPVVAFYGIYSHDRINVKQIRHDQRSYLFANAVTLIKERPALGYGMQGGQYSFDSIRYERHRSDSNFVNTWQHGELVDCHNQYLQSTLEYGVLGLAVLLTLFIAPVFIAPRRRRLFTGCFMGLLGFQSLFDLTVCGPEFGVIFGMMMTLFLGNREQSLE